MEKQIENNEPLNFEKVWFMFQETDKKFQEVALENDKRNKALDKKFLETDKKFLETDKKFQEVALENDKRNKELDKKFLETRVLFERQSIEYDKRFKDTNSEITGIGKSNGQVAEDFFYSALHNSLTVGNLKFDYIDRNKKRDRNNIEAEYDIVLFNEYKVLIVEVKYNFKQKYLRDFYKNLKNFRTLYPEYKKYKLYAAVAGMTFENNVCKEASEYGFYVLTQNNENIKILNELDFAPNQIK